MRARADLPYLPSAGYNSGQRGNAGQAVRLGGATAVGIEAVGDRPLDVSVVVVSYNTAALLRQCLRSILADPGPSREVLVVDNASTDGSPQMVADEFPDVRLITNAGNVGFSRANNQALERSSGRYACLLNSDAELRPGCLAAMVAYLDAHPRVGVLGPRLVYADGTPQPSRRRFPTLATAFVESTILQRWWPGADVLRRYYLSDVPDDRPQEVDWVTGACLMVRREAMAQVGLLDERFFMYSEELDWCRRIKAAGWRVAYTPDAVVVHHESRSAEQNLARRSILFHDSKCRYFAKYHGPLWGGILRLFIFLTFVYQYVEEGLKYVLGHRRPLRRQRLAMIREVLGWQARRLVGLRT